MKLSHLPSKPQFMKEARRWAEIRDFVEESTLRYPDMSAVSIPRSAGSRETVEQSTVGVYVLNNETMH